MNYNDVLSILRQHAKTLLKEPELALTGLGAAHPDKAPPGSHDTWCLLAHVTDVSVAGCNALDEYEALLSDRIEELTGFEGVVVRVEKRRKHRPFQAEDLPPTLNTRRWFPNPCIGISITNAKYPDYGDGNLTAGTLGLFAKKGDARYLISNNHVLADENNAQVESAIVQPGTLDLSELEKHLMDDLDTLTQNTQIAKLSGFVELLFETPDDQPVNKVDLAWAELLDPPSDEDLSLLAYSGRCIGVGPRYTQEPGGEVQGDVHVYKVGRTTGYTEGQVVSIHYYTTIAYEQGDGVFEDQLAIEATDANGGAFSLAGDSGSAILDSHHRVVGLLFGGGDITTIANPISFVIDALDEGMELITSPALVNQALAQTTAPAPDGAVVKLQTQDVGLYPGSAQLVMYQYGDGAFAQIVQPLSQDSVQIPTSMSLSATLEGEDPVIQTSPDPSIMYQVIRKDKELTFTRLADTDAPDEYMVVNRLSRGSLSISLHRGDAIAGTKTNVSPHQMAVFSRPQQVALAIFDKDDIGDTLDLSKSLSDPALILNPTKGDIFHVKVVYSPSRELREEPSFLLTLTGPTTHDKPSPQAS